MSQTKNQDPTVSPKSTVPPESADLSKSSLSSRSTGAGAGPPTADVSDAGSDGGRSRTREALLDAAEVLFANGGIQGTSLRAVTSEAGANLAAVNYHFGNKVGLVRAVFERRIRPVNAERLRALDELEGAAGESGPPLAPVIEAFMSPVTRMGAVAATAHFKRLMARSFTEPGIDIRDLLRDQFEGVTARFGAAIARAVPGIPRDVLFWRFHFMLGAMIQVAQNGPLILEHSKGLCDTSQTKEVTARLVEFVTAGFEAPIAGGPPHRDEGSGAEADASESESSEAVHDDGAGDGTDGIFPWEEGF